jgi:ABC-type phosphate/phosphonate transport system permease subunit
MLPRACQRFFALMLYRPEMIIPESAILGMLGVAALGFMSIAQSRTSV